AFIAAVVFDCPQQLAKGDFTFAAHDGINVAVGISLRSHARVVTAHDYPHVCSQRTQQIDNFFRGLPLECHDREPHEVGLDRFHQLFDGRSNTSLRQDEVGDGDLVVRVDVSGERSERTVGHTNANRGCMLEGIRHGEQQYFQWRVLSEEQGKTRSNRSRSSKRSANLLMFLVCSLVSVSHRVCPRSRSSSSSTKRSSTKSSTLALAALASVSAWTSKVPLSPSSVGEVSSTRSEVFAAYAPSRMAP